MPMNGALSSHTKSGNFSQPMSGTLGGKTTAVKEFVIETGQTDIGWKSNSFVGKNEHLLKSGQLGRCNDPLCTTCPTNYDFKAAHKKYNKASASETKLHNALYGDAKGWAQKSFSSVKRCIPGIMNPHTKVVQQWNIFFVLSCLVALFVDPLFFFLLSVQKGNKCIQFNWSFANAIVIVRSFTDFIYLLHMLLQFRLAYFAPESRVVGVRDLVDHPKKIALHYLSGYFLLDIFVVLPLNQIMTWAVFPKYLGSSLVNYAENLIPAAVGLQYILKIMRFLPLIAGQSASGFIFKSALINVVINLLIFVVAPHVVGSFWYRLGVQQISTLAGNQVPSFFIGEVVFTMCIIGLGLFLFALVIGNMQTFLQSLGRRTLEMQLRCRDVEKWMSHRQLPEDLRRQVRLSEIFNWVAHRGVNEEALMENLPEDLQKDIRRHLFKFLKKVCIFTEMEDPILDAIYERLKQKLYIQGSKVLYQGAPIDKMVFIVRGKMESVRDGNPTPLLEGDVCGQELLTWCLEHSSVNGNGKKIRLSGQQLLSNRTVKCLTNVVAFVLRAEDLKEVATTFAPFLPSPRIRGHKVRIARLERRHSKLHSCSMEIQEASESGSEQQTST
ncbi:probable cyclic nucleotide-gated ion channel 20, chloroplastic isoform X2 [Magnolia sinica]|nr:probable cyclic nucleotide-gated ion channel 20, chloroplastic isoform X2 [Magnolia sinica]